LASVPIRLATEVEPLPIGEFGPVFAGLAGVDGRTYGTNDFGDATALVLLFTSNRCPTAKNYDGRLNAFQRELGLRGVQLLAINSNNPCRDADERFECMVSRAEEGGFTFPYLADHDQRVARSYGPECTFHAFVLDRERRLRYRGRVDDSRLPERVTKQD